MGRDTARTSKIYRLRNYLQGQRVVGFQHVSTHYLRPFRTAAAPIVPACAHRGACRVEYGEAGACVIAVGNAVADHLRRREFPRKVTPVIHYSSLAGRARTARLARHEDRFREFESSISSKDVLATAQEVLEESRVPTEIYKEALARVARSQLSEFRRKLVYCYKLDFEAMKARPRRDPAAF